MAQLILSDSKFQALHQCNFNAHIEVGEVHNCRFRCVWMLYMGVLLKERESERARERERERERERKEFEWLFVVGVASSLNVVSFFACVYPYFSICFCIRFLHVFLPIYDCFSTCLGVCVFCYRFMHFSACLCMLF